MKRLILLILIFIMLFAVGCSNYYVGNSNTLPTLNPALSDKNDHSPSQGSTTPLGRETASVGVLNIDSYFPFNTQNNEMKKFLFLVYDPLVKMDSNYRAEFCLAEDVYTTDGGITWTIKLRNNVKWHNGDMFCADDVIYTINYVKSRYSPYIRMVNDVCNMEKISDLQLNIQLNEADATFPSKLIFPIVRNNSREDIFPCGTGMYRFEKVDDKGSYIFNINDKYFGKKSGIQQLIFTSYGSEKELIESDSDFMFVAEANALNTIVSGKKAYTTHGKTLCVLLPSAEMSALDSDIRKAVSNALDIQAIIKNAVSGFAGIKSLPIAENTWFNHKDSSYRPEGFTEITLENLGYSSPIAITICADENNYEHVAVAKKTVEQLNQAGFAANFVTYRTQEELNNINYSFLVTEIDIAYSWDFSLAFAENTILSYNITAIKNAYMTPNDTGVTDMASFEEYMKLQTRDIAEKFYEDLPYIGIYSGYSALLVDEEINGRTNLTITAWDHLLGFGNLY